MSSAPVRDPLADHFLTPQNAALLLIDYQPSQLACGVRDRVPADSAGAVSGALSSSVAGLCG